MSSTGKFLVIALVVLNLGLVGLLLFRDQSIVPASADVGVPSPVAVSAVAPVATIPDEPERITIPEPIADPAPVVPKPVVPKPVVREPVVREPVVREPVVREPVAKPVAKPVARKPVAEPEPPAPEPETRVASLDPPWIGDTAEVMKPPVVAAPQPVTVKLLSGTSIPVTLDIGLHSRQVRRGDAFEVSLDDDIVVDGRILARAGDPVSGRIVDVVTAGRVEGREQLRLTLSELTLAGKMFSIEASILTMTAESDKDRDLKIVGATSVVGAIIGGITKGKKGAAAGAATGAAAGAGVVLSTRGRPIVLDSGSRLDFVLERSVRVTLPPEPIENDLPEEDETPLAYEEAPGVARR